MPIEVIMPKVDMDMASGKVVTWHVAVGEAVAKGEPLFDIETDKAAMEVEAPADGHLHHTVAEGTDVPIGQAVAWLYEPGEEVGEAPCAAPQAAEPDPEPKPATFKSAASAPLSDKLRATPKARALARDAGADLADVTGTGPRGRIQGADVVGLLKAPSTSQPTDIKFETGPLSVTRSKGGTGIPIVLIHGFASEAAAWAPFEPLLQDRPLIRIDLPGHGRSPNLRITEFADLIKPVRQAFDALNIDGAHLVGHSLGGAVAMALADTRPRKVAALSLLCPAGLGPEVHGDALIGICRASRAASIAPWLRKLVVDERIISDAYVRSVMARREDATQRAAQGALAEAVFPDGVQAFDLRAALHRITCPTQIIWGRQDRIIPWRHALTAQGQIALHLFDACGHLPHVEHAEEVGKLILAL